MWNLVTVKYATIMDVTAQRRAVMLTVCAANANQTNLRVLKRINR